MKRVKVMLMSIALVAIVGGFLAFNVKTTKKYCTAATITTVLGGSPTCIDAFGTTVSCTSGIITTGVLGSASPTICYTTVAATATACPALCPNLGVTTTEE